MYPSPRRFGRGSDEGRAAFGGRRHPWLRTSLSSWRGGGEQGEGEMPDLRFSLDPNHCSNRWAAHASRLACMTRDNVEFPLGKFFRATHRKKVRNYVRDGSCGMAC